MTDALEPGDLIATHSKGLVGRLIRFGEKVAAIGWPRAVWHSLTQQQDNLEDPWYFNHIAVYIGNGELVEALARGLCVSPLAKYSEYKVLSLRKVCDVWKPQQENIDDLLWFATASYARHTAYGWLSIAAIVLTLLTPVKLDVSWDGSLICSAFGAQCWEHAGVTLPTRSSLMTKPSDLVRFAG